MCFTAGSSFLSATDALSSLSAATQCLIWNERESASGCVGMNEGKRKKKLSMFSVCV